MPAVRFTLLGRGVTEQIEGCPTLIVVPKSALRSAIAGESDDRIVSGRALHIKARGPKKTAQMLVRTH